MRSKPVSFINEHTASYALVPYFTSIFKQHFETVVPLLFWVSREGSWLARNNMIKSHYRLAILFPRRPKFLNDMLKVYIKLNESLFLFSHSFNNYDLPVLAGFPYVLSLDQLNNETPCYWIKLNPDDHEKVLEFDSIEILNERNLLSKKDELIKDIMKSPEFSYDQICDMLRQANTQSGLRYFFGGIKYRPLIFLLK